MTALATGDGLDEFTAGERQRALVTAVEQGSRNARTGIEARRAAEHPVVSKKEGSRHSRLVAAFDYCRRPSLYGTAGGVPVVKDSEAATMASMQAMLRDEWQLRVGAEGGRYAEARMFYLASAAARAQLLQGMAAGADTRVVDAPNDNLEAQMYYPQQ